MKITELYIYPIKSLRPVSVQRTRLRPEGPEHDRRFMLLQPPAAAEKGGGEAGNGPAVYYQNIQVVRYPECALFHQAIVDDEIVVTYRAPPLEGQSASEEQKQAATEETPLRVPLRPRLEGRETVPVRLFGSAAPAYRMGEPYDTWFSARFGKPVILVYIGDSQRPVLAHSPNNNNNRLDPNSDSTAAKGQGQVQGQGQGQGQGWLSGIASYLTGGGGNSNSSSNSNNGSSNGSGGSSGSNNQDFLTFNEAAPFLVTSRASLRDVTARLPQGEAVDMINFRPNIVVDDDEGSSSSSGGSGEQAEETAAAGENGTLQAWDEDYWAELVVGERRHRLALTANCARCVSINIDYETGRPAEGERGSVLKKLMGDRRVDHGNKWSPIFGRYAFLLRGEKSLPDDATAAAAATGAKYEKEEEAAAAVAAAAVVVAGGEEERGRDSVAAAEAAGVEIAVGDEVKVARRISERDVWRWPKTA